MYAHRNVGDHKKIMRRLLTILLLVALTSCLDNSIVVTENMKGVAEELGKKFGAEEFVFSTANSKEGKPLENSVELTFKNCRLLDISSETITDIQDSVANRLILSCDDPSELPSSLKITFYEGYDYFVVSNQHTLSQTYGANYILEQLVSREAYQNIEQRITELLNANRTNEAMAYCDSIIATGQNTEIPYQYRAYLHTINSDVKKAIEDFESAVRVNSDNELNYWNLSLVYAQLNDFKTALDYVDTSLAKLPNQSRAIYYRGYYLYKLGERTKGCNEMDQAKMLGFQVDNQTPTVTCE